MVLISFSYILQFLLSLTNLDVDRLVIVIHLGQIVLMTVICYLRSLIAVKVPRCELDSFIWETRSSIFITLTAFCINRALIESATP